VEENLGGIAGAGGGGEDGETGSGVCEKFATSQVVARETVRQLNDDEGKEGESE